MTRIAVVLGAWVTMCAASTPASAVALPTTQPDALATTTVVARNITESTGGPIRECFLKSCDSILTVVPGTTLEWSHFAYNQFGNRWYFVKDAKRNANFSGGWIYCGNVTAGC